MHRCGYQVSISLPYEYHRTRTRTSTCGARRKGAHTGERERARAINRTIVARIPTQPAARLARSTTAPCPTCSSMQQWVSQSTTTPW